MGEAGAEAALLACCGSPAWAKAMSAARPFADRVALLETADRVWWSLPAQAWLEAFAAHPRIGERAGADVDAQSSRWSEDEQRNMRQSNAGVRNEIRARNREYEERFGYMFLICAQGLTGAQILHALRERLRHDPAGELRIAAEEQRRITHLRLDRLIGS